jgi:hypothetical protein
MIKKNIVFLLALIIGIRDSALLAQSPEGLESDSQAVFAHIQMLQELKGRFESTAKEQPDVPKMRTFDEVLKHRCNSQTYSWISEYDSLARDFFRRAPEFFQVLAQECAHADDYYVFYHGESFRVAVLQYVLKKIQSFLKLLPQRHPFAYLRIPPLKTYDNITDFLLAEQPCHIDRWLLTEEDKAFIDQPIETGLIPGVVPIPRSQVFDHMPHIKQQLLSVNLSLFGGGSMSESSFFYAFLAENITTVGLDQFMDTLFDYYHLDNAQKQELIAQIIKLEDVAERSPRKFGTLLQIFVPKNDVDRYAYPAARAGFPVYKPIPDDTQSERLQTTCGIIPSGYRYEQNTFWRMSEVLDRMLKDAPGLNEELAKQDLDLRHLQGRMLIPLFMSPESNVKIYKRSAFDLEKTYKETPWWGEGTFSQMLQERERRDKMRSIEIISKIRAERGLSVQELLAEISYYEVAQEKNALDVLIDGIILKCVKERCWQKMPISPVGILGRYMYDVSPYN